ncbi:MAG: DUF4292 domain-containing protein [Paludibacteraceae bacterium]|nr:DUF4292 domain-containing protein [Paludibacteraceae bacterium]
MMNKMRHILLLSFLTLLSCLSASAVELKGDKSDEAQAAFKALIERIKQEKGVATEKWNNVKENTKTHIDTIKANVNEQIEKAKQNAMEKMLNVEDVETLTDTAAPVAPREVSGQGEDVKLKLNLPDFTTANFSSVEVDFTHDGQQMQVNASIKMIRDSIIQISLRVLGIEGARVDITPRRVTVYNKIYGRYVDKNMDDLAKYLGLDLDFYDLQALLGNQLFLAGDTADTNADVVRKSSIDEHKDGYDLMIDENESGFTHAFFLDKKKRLTETRVAHKIATLSCTYDKFESFKGGVTFPTVINATLKERKNTEVAIITIKRAEFNKTVTINQTNKSKYTRVDHLNELLKQ